MLTLIAQHFDNNQSKDEPELLQSSLVCSQIKGRHLLFLFRWTENNTSEGCFQPEEKLHIKEVKCVPQN